MSDTPAQPGFEALGLPDYLLKSLSELGYESPSPIQAASIPLLLNGTDMVGQAQTGTGKTAAFTLPLLARLSDEQTAPQALIMTPTRELAIQVAEAVQRYARHSRSIRVAAIYGGQDFRPQLKALKQGVQVVVGTPGRLLDHLRRGSLDISKVSHLVLDEADEMLRMGFIEDVEAILSHCPGTQQTALFSATMPPAIRRIAEKYLRSPQEIHIKAATATVDRVAQSYWQLDNRDKPEALRRYLETQETDAVIVFVRTRESASEIAEKINAWGYRAEPIHGAVSQAQRERTITGLKKNKFDILVATDVAARGLDVDRFSHVVNYDIPYDCESYVHRIGRTGRAGRSGEAILFVTRRENRLLRLIEKHTRQRLERADMPSDKLIAEHRLSRFKVRVSDKLQHKHQAAAARLVTDLCHDLEIEAEQLAAALLNMLQADDPILPEEIRSSDHGNERSRDRKRDREQGRDSDRRDGRANARVESRREEQPIDADPDRLETFPEVEMERFRIEVGRSHGVKPGDIVGAIANETGLDSDYIGTINLRQDFSTVDLPEGMPKELFGQLKKIRVRQQPLRITRFGKEPAADTLQPAAPERKPRKRKEGSGGPGFGKKGDKKGGKRSFEGKSERKNKAAAKGKSFGKDFGKGPGKRPVKASKPQKPHNNA